MSYDQAEAAKQPRQPGAVEELALATERLHHEINVLSERLEPVLRNEAPLVAAEEKIGAASMIVDQVNLVNSATDRLITLMQRLAI